MKKVLSAVLASAMMVAMASASLAAPVADFFSTGGILGAAEQDMDGVPEYMCRPKESVDGLGDYLVHSKPAEYGSSVYFELAHAGGSWENFSLDMIRNFKIKTEWEQGGDLVESVEVAVLKKGRFSSEPVYFPALIIKLKDSTAVTDADVIGTITLNKRKGEQAYRIKDAEIPVQFTASYYYDYMQSYGDTLGLYVIDHDQQFICPGDPYLLKFDYDDEVELTFGSESNEGSFTVDVSGQGKVLLLFDTMSNSAVEAANPNANMLFFGFNHVQFNRTGEFFYETETGGYIYELIDGMPVEIAMAEYDQADGGFRFHTHVLGNYVISDIPLVAPDPEAAKAAELSGGARFNPVTRKYSTRR